MNKFTDMCREIDDRTYILSTQGDRGDVYFYDEKFFLVDIISYHQPILGKYIFCENYWNGGNSIFKVLYIHNKISDNVWMVDLEEVDQSVYRNELLNSLLDGL